MVSKAVDTNKGVFCPIFAQDFEDKFVLVYFTSSGGTCKKVNLMQFEIFLRRCCARVERIYALELGT